MTTVDAIVVGGGPGGSTCARVLRTAGWNVVVLDRARFPRDKVCAGWLTPEVFRSLDLAPETYRATGLTFQEITGFRTSVIGAPGRGAGRDVETRYPRVVSYAIRRCEFDDYLLRRSGATLLEGTPLATLQRGRDRWIVNDTLETPVVVGAGGHFCPVARFMTGPSEARPVIAKEAEFPIGGLATRGDSLTPELFFCRDLDGYGWCVRKGSYLNVGLGRRDKRQFARHLDEFVSFLERRQLMPRGVSVPWRGHAYLAAGTGQRPLVGDGLLLVGDAAGLAYPESGEGIRPAIESGRLAAEILVAAGGRATRDALEPYERTIRRKHPPAPRGAPAVHTLSAAIGRVLLRSPTFTRRVVIDRWFLRRAAIGSVDA